MLAMTPATAATLFHAALLIAIKIAAPLLGSMTVMAILFGILQAATQVQDAIVSFTPKLLAALCVIWLLSAWMAATMDGFTRETLDAIPWIVMR
jgi:flagellar biosynthetic protein FliQ